jgi:hypothetical protein
MYLQVKIYQQENNSPSNTNTTIRRTEKIMKGPTPRMNTGTNFICIYCTAKLFPTACKRIFLYQKATKYSAYSIVSGL